MASCGATLPRIAITSGIKPGWEAGGRLWESYARAIAEAGGEPVWIGAATLPETPVEALDAVLNRIDGLLLSGGADLVPADGVYDGMPAPDDPGLEASAREFGLETEPERDAYEVPLARRALERDMPVMGVCRGFQLLNVVLGGRLVPDLRTGLRHRAFSEQESARHKIEIASDGRIASCLGSGYIEINSRHHQGVTPQFIASGLVPTAHAPDGVIEVLEAPNRPWWFAIQWHPERPDDPALHARDRVLFRHFLDECARASTRQLADV